MSPIFKKHPVFFSGSIYVLVAVLAILFLTTVASFAQTEIVLYTFAGTKGFFPSDLIRDTQGNLYGTTFAGGANNNGIVFEVNRAGAGRVLYNFTGGTNGSYPRSILQDSSGNFYGVTTEGGTNTCFQGYGCGVVFKMTPSGSYTVLHTFVGTDGENPSYGLIQDAAGNLYGTTYAGGAYDSGTVFKLSTAGTLTVLYNFTGEEDGGEPAGYLVRDGQGNFYGTALGGGLTAGCSGCGVVYKLAPNGTETVLYSFTGGSDGSIPAGGVIRDREGNLYGTAQSGGDSTACDGGCGTVFELSASGVFTVLHTFTSKPDGANPEDPLVRDTEGNLYGTTAYGGTLYGSAGFGIVFELTPDGTMKILHSFTGYQEGNDGAWPSTGLIRDASGNLYGITEEGGARGYGDVYEVTP